MSPLTRRLRLALTLCAVWGAGKLPAQTRPLPPPPDTLRERVLREVKAPPGFDLTVFAAPPQLVYPACLEATPAGELFACVEPNLNFDRVKGRGRIVRLVDGDGDGVADRYSVFADGVDSPRGLVYDGGTLYVMHAPTLSAMRDTDGDGVADERKVLVSGLGFGLDDRGGDHTSNGLALGMDGWLYLAVGDYGFVAATGSDGRTLQLRGGGVLRVRPDGSEMEIVARGTRNIYDVAVDPYARVFARDNNNNGQGWGVRLHYLPEGANVGYPALFRDFPEDALPPLADYGAGAGTAALWIHDPGFPRELDNTLYTADWGLNRIFRHRLQPRGASFAVEQEEFLTIPRPSDLAMDGRSNLYVASLSGGAFNYSGEHVGYVVRLRQSGAASGPLPPTETMDAPRLVEMLASAGAVPRRAAQRELLRRPPAEATRLLERLALDRSAPPYARAAAIFALKQALGARSHSVLVRAAEDPAVRAPALRALTDRRGETAGVPVALLLRALSDADPAVRLEGVNALRRLGAPAGVAAGELLRLAAGTDTLLSHVAVDALVELRASTAALAALDAGDGDARAAALRVLQRVHTPEIVGALIERASRATDPESRSGVLRALARLYHRDAPWAGAWWDVLPSTDGPYHDPATWSESARIRPVLEEALLAAGTSTLPALLRDYARNRVIPKGADSLLLALAREGDARRAVAARALVGRREVDAAAVPLLGAIAAGGGARGAAVVRLLASQALPEDASVPLLRTAALDGALPPDLRVQALGALGRLPGSRGVVAAAEAYARLGEEPEPALEQAWRRFAGERRHGPEIEHFLALARADDPGERALGYAVLVQIARTTQHPRELRDRAAGAIEAGWGAEARAASLVRAIERMNATALYAERLGAYRAAHPPR